MCDGNMLSRATGIRIGLVHVWIDISNYMPEEHYDHR